MSAHPAVLAGDVALCHPTFGRGEVRAVARQMHDPNTFRLTVVAADRRGLLADTAGVLGAHGLSITEASAATWPKRGIALHALTITDAAEVESTTWKELGADLRAVGAHGGEMRPAFKP